MRNIRMAAQKLRYKKEETMAEDRKQSFRPGDSNRINREYLDSLLVEMRQIGAQLPDTNLELYGHTFSTPVMTAALSHLDSCCPNGMVEMAKGAARANAVMWAGMGSDEELEAIAGTGAKTIKIIKPYADEALIFHKIRHAEQCGALAVGMDIDHAFGHQGGYDVVLGQQMRPKTAQQLHSYLKATSLPFIVKGVLSVQDALLCVEIGVGGIVVSHHHGILDYAVPPLRVLPDIAAAVGGKFPVFVDCGLESGADVFKAMALGATAASIGRKMMEDLHEAGNDGALRRIEAATAELSVFMARTGTKDLSQFDSSIIWKR